MEREMWLIWKEPIERRRYKIGKLTILAKQYTFKYINPELDDATKFGFNFFPGFEDTHKIYKSDKLFANIETRLPNTSRPDYLEILNSYGLEIDSNKYEILKATKGRLITDNYEFVPVFDNNKIEFDVAGTRHCKDIEKCKNILSVNDKLELELEPDNKYDDNAIKVICNKNGKKYHLGYVPRYYSSELTEILKKNVKYSAMIQSINFKTEIFDEDVSACVKLIFNNN